MARYEALFDGSLDGRDHEDSQHERINTSHLFPESAEPEASSRESARVAPLSDVELFPPAPRAERGWDPVGVVALFDGEAREANRNGGTEESAGISATSAPRTSRATRRRISGKAWAIIISCVVVLAVAAGVAAVVLGNQRAKEFEALNSAKAQLASDQHDARVQASGLAADLSDFALHLDSERAVAGGLADPVARMAGVSDEGLRAAAAQAQTTYLDALRDVALPRMPAELQQADATSMAEVDDARRELTAYQAQLDVVERAFDDIAQTQGVAEATFHRDMSAFTESMPGFAAQLVQQNPDATQSIRDALTAAAAAVASTVPYTPNGTAPWDPYITAVNALRADQLRAMDERNAAEQSGTDSGTRGSQSTTPEQTTNPTTPDTPSTETSVPTPEPSATAES